ncbi:hypothetical protein HUJ04_004050 [Dendroctonus ponderosae]|nr:hypothetical protein HUJ04_004050 [Dendroctonus ponderosae]
MGQRWNKFALLMWKNWMLQYRKPLQTVIEILAPVLFSILLVVIRSLVDPESHDAVAYKPFCTIPNLTAANTYNLCGEPQVVSSKYQSAFRRFTSLAEDATNGTAKGMLLYTPQDEASSAIMAPLNSSFELVGFNSSTDMETHFLAAGQAVFAGVEFYNLSKENVDFALRFPAELRNQESILIQSTWRTNLVFPVFQTAGPRTSNSSTGATPNYYQEGFLALQHLLSVFITMHNSGITIPKGSNLTEWMIALNGTSEKIPFIYMRRFPNAEWKEDVLLTPLKSFVSIIVMLSFVYTCINTVKVITTEKEKQLKEAMKIMGLPNWLHWIAWFLKTFSYLMISIILMVVLLKVRWYTNTEYTVFTYANPIVLLIFLFFYVCATITFCFAVSVFFSKANTAATIAGLAWFLSYAPYSFMQNNYDTLSLSAKLVASLGSNTAMAFGFQVILMYEGTGEGVQFNNIWKPNTPDDDLSLGLLMVVLTVDALIYLLVALYIEAVFPGEYGVPQKWYFPFTATFWCGQPRHSGVESFEEAAVKNEAEFFETDPQNLSAGIKIRKLRKVFGTKAAVRNLSLNMYQDQITVLLGHNGAGKTTTMSMLTGMFTPTSGTAIVNGYDIRSEMEGVRRSLGLCPQHNIIFDDLTVAEHLYFFSKLKGMTSKWEIESEITKYVDLLELQPKVKYAEKLQVQHTVGWHEKETVRRCSALRKFQGGNAG